MTIGRQGRLVIPARTRAALGRATGDRIHLRLDGDKLVIEAPGAPETMGGAVLGTANLAEVVGKLIDAGIDATRLRGLLVTAGARIEPLTTDDAELAGALRAVPGGRALSLADRCCPALAVRSTPAVVLTADRSWSTLDLPITVRLIR